MTWVEIAVAAVSAFALWLLAPTPRVENARESSFEGMQYPRSSEGSPIPLLFGKTLIRSPNTIWADGFRTLPNRILQKGFLSSSYQTVSYNYIMSIGLALVLGPGIRLHAILVGKNEVWSGDLTGGQTISISKPMLFGGEKEGGGFVSEVTFYDGSFTQNEDPTIASFLSTTPAYRGISYVLFKDMEFGTSPSLRPIRFEASNYTDGLNMGPISKIGEDANPAEVLYQILTRKWGGMDINVLDLNLDSFKAAATTLAAEKNGISVLIGASQKGDDIVTEILRQIDGILYPDVLAQTLTLKLIRPGNVTGDYPVLDESNVVSISEYIQTSWSDTYNNVRVFYKNRDARYQKSSAIAQDLSNISMQERLKTKTLTFPYCTSSDTANSLAARELSQTTCPLFKVTLVVTRQIAEHLVPGNLFSFSWDAFGIEKMILRLERFQLGTLENGDITIECVQERFSLSQTVFKKPSVTLARKWDLTATPPSKAEVLELPYPFASREGLPSLGTDKTYIFSLSRSSREVEVSYNADYHSGGETLSTMNEIPFQGSAVLSHIVNETDGFDGSPISLSLSDPYHLKDPHSVDTQEIRSGKNLIMIGTEIMAYETYTENPDGSIALGKVHRALLDTTFETHASSSTVWFLDLDGLVPNPVSGSLPSSSFAKFTTNTVQDRSSELTVPFHTNRRYERPFAPVLPKINSLRSGISTNSQNLQLSVTWTERSRLSSSVVLCTDPSVSPPTGVTYEIKVFAGSVLQSSLTKTGLTGTSATIALPGTFPSGPASLEIHASRMVDSVTLESAVASKVYFTHV